MRLGTDLYLMSDCTHFWKLGKPRDGITLARCKRCAATRTFDGGTSKEPNPFRARQKIKHSVAVAERETQGRRQT